MVITAVGCCTGNASIRDGEEALIWGSVDTSILVFTQVSLVPSHRTKTTAVRLPSTAVRERTKARTDASG